MAPKIEILVKKVMFMSLDKTVGRSGYRLARA